MEFVKKYFTKQFIFDRRRRSYGRCIYSEIRVQLHGWASQRYCCWLQALENVHYCYLLCFLALYNLKPPFCCKNTYLLSFYTFRISHFTLLLLSLSNCFIWTIPDDSLRFLFTLTASVYGFLPRCSHFFLWNWPHSTFSYS